MNIVLVCLTSLRADRVSSYGYHRETTPSLDRFASDATTFLNAYATAPWTPPSYSSVLTGLFPWNNGVMSAAKLGPEYPTIGSQLRAAGYRTAAFVTAHHTGAYRGMDRGFHEFTQVGTGRFNKGSEETTDLAMEWLEGASRDARPFLLTVHYHELHQPYLPPRGHRGRYADMRKVREDNDEVRRAFRNPLLYMMGTPRPATLSLLSDLYDDEVAYLDREHLGPLLTRLGDLGLLDDTIIVVVSLHGESLGEHDSLAHAANVHETCVRVPLIIRHPTALKGVRVADLVQLTDVLPTLVQFVGVPAPERLDGWPIRAFAPQATRRTFVAAQWSNEKSPGWRRRVDADPKTHTDFVERLTEEQLMLRVGRFKYIAGAEEQLFDLLSDPGELVNLVEQHPGQAGRLRSELRRLVAHRVQIPYAEPPPPDIARDLRRMGYTS